MLPRIDWSLVYLAAGYGSSAIALCCLSGASLVALIWLFAGRGSRR